jgi:TRAP-type C4-dicarboxylate transport system substrate-binding protein
VYCRADLSRTVAVVVALFLTAVPTGVVARDFRAADTQSEDYPTVQALYYMGRLIAENSGGRLQIKVFHSHQLGEEKETIEQTRAGAIDLNRTNVALIGSFVPAMNVLAMPFLFRSIEHMRHDQGARRRTGRAALRTSPWQSLSDEDKKIFRDAAIKSSRFMREKWRELEERSRQQAKAAGVTIVTDIDRKPFEEAMAGIYAKAQADPAAAALIERIRKAE